MDRDEINEKLTPRQRQILKVLVQEYVSSATAVGSSTIQQLGGVGVSSATIRNELATLEELGYVAQPHTSAGRIPTVKGYRYFVEQLMEEAELPLAEQRMIRHQFHQIRHDLEQWMRLSAAVLARTAQAASLVTPPRAVSSRFRHLELISINDALCLMILVLQDGSIHQEMLAAPGPTTQEALGQISNQLNTLLANRTVREIQSSTNPELTGVRDWEATILGRVLRAMHQVEQEMVREVYRDGLVNVLNQPEFVDAVKFRQLVEILEHRTLLESILTRILSASGVQVIIGGEGAYQEIDDVSLVLAPYGVRGTASGIMGIMGPTRMRYARAICTVRYVADLMDSLLAEVYGVER
jgi:heat-inducible transcriptional repressor